MRRTMCSGCGYDDLRMVLDLGLSPVADAYTSHPDEVSQSYPLQLAVCTGCWLVQLLEVVDHGVLFGTGYSFYSSASAPLSAYHERYARDVLDRYADLAKSLVVEIGCNDGDMLRHFHGAGCQAIGVDPSGGPVDVARSRGLAVWNTSFDSQVGAEIRSAKGPAGVVIANHVLAHVESVSSVLEGISVLLSADGVAMIEVQYLPDLLVNNAFDLVYHEHRNFFSLSSLEKAAMRHGLYVSDVELTDRQGGSLRATLTRGRKSTPLVDSVRASESWLRGTGAYEGLQGRAERIRTRLRDLVFSDIDRGKLVAGFGAPAKATTLLNFCGMDRNWLSFVVDSTPAKQGRYIPGTGIPILSYQDVNLADVDTFVLLAWNYARQIMAANPGHSSRGGSWIIPEPAPIVL